MSYLFNKSFDNIQRNTEKTFISMNQKILSSKRKRVLQIIGIILFIIVVKVWYLSVIAIDEKKKEANRPQRKSILIHANRGAIYDTNNIPLAYNRIKYNACIYYAHIRQIPSVKWKRDEEGNKIKSYPRKEHIRSISLLLGKELYMDPDRIEDLIHSKAALLPHVPFVIKENISEKDYYKLRMLERNQSGIHAEISPERYYPQSMLASDVLGYMGAISQEKYLSIAAEIKSLELLMQKEDNLENPALPQNFNSFDDVKNRLIALKEISYSVNDLVGKAGLENKYDETLRGIHGKKTYAVDVKGNFLKEVSTSKKCINGKKVISSISMELQEFAENLLAKDEKHRDDKNTKYNRQTKQMEPQKQPFIKGGAIIAMDPNNGEILTLASYPRFNPNDFISSSNSKLKQEKQNHIFKWLEHPRYVANIFDGKEEIVRELYSDKAGIFEERKNLSLKYFLELILPSKSEIFFAMEKIENIKNAILIEENMEALLFYGKTDDANKIIDCIFQEQKKHILTSERLSPTEKSDILFNLDVNSEQTDRLIENLNFFLKDIKDNTDKVLVIDLLKVIVYNPSFSDELIDKIGHLTLSQYWKATKSIIACEEKLKYIIRPLFSEYEFKKWKEVHRKDFLKHKREEEKEKGKYAKPYLDYLDQMENMLFDEFWSNNRIFFISSFLKEEISEDHDLFVYLKALLDIKKAENFLSEDRSREAFIFLESNFGYLNFEEIYNLVKTTRAFDDLERPLYGKYFSYIKNRNNCEKNLAACFYPRNGFGYGRSQAFRQSTPLGSIFKVTVAYSALKKHYNYLVNIGKHLKIINPLTMTDVIKWDRRAKKGGSMVVGYGEDNTPYPRYYKGGRLPKSAHDNIGKIDVISALAQSSNPYFSILAADYLSDPEDLITDAKNFSFGMKTGIDLPGEISGILPKDLLTNKTGLYSFAIGQHSFVSTPLQSAVMLCSIANGGKVLKPQIIKGQKEIIRDVSMPPSVRNTILEGLDKTVWGEKGGARASVIKKLRNDKDAYQRYNHLKHKMVGKTSTAEMMHKLDITSHDSEKYNHIWFGSIYFDEERNWDRPKLVVVVYLRYGDGGKEAAPIAADMIHKYIELEKKYNVQNQEMISQ